MFYSDTEQYLNYLKYIANTRLVVIWVLRQDDQHWNPNIDNRYHLVGQLTIFEHTKLDKQEKYIVIC